MSWRFALRPKWLVRHVLVVVLCGVMIALGMWQLRRLDEKRAYRDLVTAQQEMPAADVEVMVPAGADEQAVEQVLYRTVTATGTYVVEDTVVVQNRTLAGASGAWVLTPLRFADGAAVVVNRGFVGYDRDGEIVPPSAPSGRVHVEGLVFPSQRRGRIGPTDPADGKLAVLARVDIDRLAAQVDYPVLPAYVQLVESDPPEPATSADAPAVVALGAPELDLGPHLAYAVQWAIFTIIAGVGYLLLLRRVASEQAQEERLDALQPS